MRLYLGTWKAYGAVEPIADLPERLPILLDQGSADEALASPNPHALVVAAEKAGHPIRFNLRDGYDHGYYLVASFIEVHLRYHAGFLGGLI